MSDVYGLMACKSDSVPAPIPLAGVKAEAEILGRGARIKVSQLFSNLEAKTIEAVYRFPLPEGAAVCGFHARLGERVIQGRIEERERAFEIYDDAMIKGHGAYLLDEERPNIFTVSVGNLPPACDVVVEIEYVTLLDASDNLVRFLLPTTISPRYIPGNMEDDDHIPVHARLHPPYAAAVPYGLSLRLNIHRGASVSSIESPSHMIRMENIKGDPVTVTFTSGEVIMDRDFLLNISYEKSFRNRAYLHRSGDETFVQLDLGLDDEKKAETALKTKPKEIIFVVDCSGSMDGDSITQAKKAVKIALKALPTDVHFNICRFGSTFNFLFKTSQKYSETSVSQGLAFLKGTRADLGGTEILAPLQHICTSTKRSNEAQRDIILLTDGEVGNEKQIFDLLKDQGRSLRVFSVGIGAGCNEYFIKGLARATEGASEFIFPGERIEPKVLSLFKKVNQTGLPEATIDWGMPGALQAPSTLGIFFGNPATIFASSVSGESPPGKVIVKGLVNGSLKSWEVVVEEADGDTLPTAVLWARERIRDIEEGSDANRLKGSRQIRKQTEARDKTLIELSRRYNLLSSRTSFVAIEERKEKDLTTGEVVLREVPALVTIGWHGIGSTRWTAMAPQSAGSPQLSLYERRSRPDRQRRADLSLDYNLMACPSELIPCRTLLKDAETGKIDDLLYVLSLQRADGGIEIDKKSALILGVDLGELKQSAEEMMVANGLDKLIILSTAAVLAALEKHFASEHHYWEPTVLKSKKWLEMVINDCSPKIGGQELVDWVEQRLDK
jgi:Ca-activated chloride channel family protein